MFVLLLFGLLGRFRLLRSRVTFVLGRLNIIIRLVLLVL